MENLNKLVDGRCRALENSDKTFEDIFRVMFSTDDYILGEWNDGYKIYTMTYKEARERILSLAAGIRKNYPDLKDSYIGLAMESSMDWILSFWAILASGNKPYLVNLRHPKSLVNHLLESLDIIYLLGTEDLGYQGNVILLSSLEGEAPLESYTFANELALSTSATTLKEKIIFYNGSEISAQILNCRKVLKENKLVKKHYKARLKLLVFLPLYHIFGFIATYMWFCYFGRTLVFLKDYTSTTILRTVRKHEVTHIFAVPLFWHTIEKEIRKEVKAKNQEKKFEKGLSLSLRLQKIFPHLGIRMSKSLMHEVTDSLFGKSVFFCISGGSYLKQSSLRTINALGYPLFNGYGMSEIGITSVELGGIKERLKNSVGKPFESVTYRICDGELYVKGQSLSHKMKINGEILEIQDEYKTMDNARMDKDGRVYILGRKDDLFIGQNGENINPDELEQQFNLSHANRFSILPIDGKLSMVVEISKYLSKDVTDRLYESILSQNAKLDSALQLQQVYFTFDAIQAETAIKVSRQYLSHKLTTNEVTLFLPKEFKENNEVEVNPEILSKVMSLMEECLGRKDITPEGNFFFDYEGNSLEYFGLISAINSHFGITIAFGNGENYHTSIALAKEVERLLSL